MLNVECVYEINKCMTCNVNIKLKLRNVVKTLNFHVININFLLSNIKMV